MDPDQLVSQEPVDLHVQFSKQDIPRFLVKHEVLLPHFIQSVIIGIDTCIGPYSTYLFGFTSESTAMVMSGLATDWAIGPSALYTFKRCNSLLI